MVEIYDFLRRIDGNTFFLINDLTKDIFWFKVIVYFIAKYLIFLYFAVLAYLFWFQNGRGGERHNAKRATIFTLLALAWAFLIDQIINLVFVRARPIESYPDAVKQLSVTIDPSSFPSSHTIFVFAIATSLYMSGYKTLGIMLFVLAVLIGFSRVASGVHYPSDVLAGAIFGVFAAWLVHREGGWVKENLLKDFNK